MAVAEGPNLDIWVYDWKRETNSRLTSDGGTHAGPIWSPDGRYVLFYTPRGIFWTRADGAGQSQPLTHSESPQIQAPGSFTADGKRLAFAQGPPGKFNIWTIPIESDGSGLKAGNPEPFLQSPFRELRPTFSPDGRWLAYQSDETGTFEIYVRAFPDKGVKRQISNGGGAFPVWSRAGRELFFSEHDRIMVAAYRVNGDSFAADKPRLWSEQKVLANLRSFDLARD